MSNHHILHIENLYKEYGTKLVLENVDLQIVAGEFCSLLGPSGCGKSTLFRMILGEERATSGIILINGKPGGYPDPTRGILYQKYALYPFLSVIENVLFGRKNQPDWRRRKKEFMDEAMYFLERVKMAENADKFPHELSGGMEQRVAIAQSLIIRPQILLMDEPFSALDSGTRESAQVFLLELANEFKMTVLFVTHDTSEAVFLGTRLVVLSQHYTDDRGENAKRGARIIKDFGDYPLRTIGTVNPTIIKTEKVFAEMVALVNNTGINPTHKEHVKDFHLKHADSFQTLTDAEWHGHGEKS